jgi:hypothetical protein
MTAVLERKKAQSGLSLRGTILRKIDKAVQDIKRAEDDLRFWQRELAKLEKENV